MSVLLSSISLPLLVLPPYYNHHQTQTAMCKKIWYILRQRRGNVVDRIIYNTASGPGSTEHPFQARSQVPGFRLTQQDSGRSPTTKSHHTSLCHRDWPLTSGNLFQKRQLTKHDKAPPLSPPFLLQDLRLLGIMENWDIHSMANPSLRAGVQSGLKAFKRQSQSSWT